MIVCHCNRITSGDITDAVGCLMSNCADPELCPENVYEELGACPRCCNCFPLAERMIDESRVAFVFRAELARLRGEEAGNDELIRDEEGHIDFIETQLHVMDTVSDQNYSQSQAGLLDADDG